MNTTATSRSSQLSFLPEPWELLESFQDTCVIAGIEFRLAGFTARRLRDQVMVSGSACAHDKDPADTAWFELLERISLVTARSLPIDTRWCLRHYDSFEAARIATSSEIFTASPQPELWVPAKSNGVAIGESWQSAVRHALCELVERHQVLASWYGAVTPRLLNSPLPRHLLPLTSAYRIEHYAMGQFDCNGQVVHTTATFIWPLDEKKSVIYGFGASSTVEHAQERSLKEALQRLCFLYDAEDAEGEADFQPTPDFHQDYFLQPSQQSAIKRWLAGEHFQERYARAVPFHGKAHWVDLTPHKLFPGKVVQVFLPGSLPLMFGRYQPPEFPELHPDLWIHPIM